MQTIRVETHWVHDKDGGDTKRVVSTHKYTTGGLVRPLRNFIEAVLLTRRLLVESQSRLLVLEFANAERI